MDCVGQPGVESEFHADFKYVFNFSVQLIPFSAESSKFPAVLRISVRPLNNLTKQANLRG